MTFLSEMRTQSTMIVIPLMHGARGGEVLQASSPEQRAVLREIRAHNEVWKRRTFVWGDWI